MKLRFLFCITGVGAGNTTRNLSIFRELEKLGDCEIRVAAQGRARELLEPLYPTEALHDVNYGDSGEFNAFDIIRSNLNFPLRFLANERLLTRIIKDYRPHLVIADSDFYCLRPARRLRVPQVSLNNAAVVVETIRARGDLPKSRRFSYHVIEKTDYWLQRTYPRRVLCPALRRTPGLSRKFVEIPPMVRQDILPLTEPGNEVVVLTGGSGINTAEIDITALEGESIRMLGTPLPRAPQDAQAVGFTLDVMQHLRRAKLLIVQGGFSSVSEAAALRAPTVVVPVANHAEQWTNGKILEELGFAVCVDEPKDTGKAARKILENYAEYWERAQRLRLRTDGQKIAARLLWKWGQKL